MPILRLSTGDTLKLLRGTRTVSTFADESMGMFDMLDESDFMLDESDFMLDESVVVVVDVIAALSPCWLCVGVGAGAPVPNWVDDESVVVVVVDVDAAGSGAGAGAGAGSAAGAGAGVVFTSPFAADVDVVCEPSFETRM
jgi:hypothetical protein